MNYLIPKIIEDLRGVIPQSDIRYYYFGRPVEVGDVIGINGGVFVTPISSSIESATTGILDSVSETVEITVAKSFKTDINENPKYEGSMEFMARLVDGRNEDGSRVASSIVSVIRKNFRGYGIRQPAVTIDWEDNRFAKEGISAVTIRVQQESLLNQEIN